MFYTKVFRIENMAETECILHKQFDILTFLLFKNLRTSLMKTLLKKSTNKCLIGQPPEVRLLRGHV